MQELLIDGVIQHIFSYNNYFELANLAQTDKLFCELVEKYTSYPMFRDFMIKSKLSFKERRKLFIFACSNGFLEEAKWLFVYNKPVSKNLVEREAFVASCLNGYLDIGKWIYSIGNIEIMTISHCHIKKIFVSDNLDTIKWLYSLYNYWNSSAWLNRYDLFNQNCIKGNLEVAKWFYYLYDATFDYYIWQTFRDTCTKGCLGVAKWLYSLDKMNINNRIEEAFIESCSHGQFEIAKWLYSLVESKISVEKIVFAFTSSYKNNHLDIVKWLHSLGVINNKYYKSAFRTCCVEGRLEIAQWIYSVANIDIQYEFEYVHRYSKKEGHSNIVQWLDSITSKNENKIE